MADLAPAPAATPAPPAPTTSVSNGPGPATITTSGSASSAPNPPNDYGIGAARNAGYSDQEITSYLAQHSNLGIAAAKTAKYSDTEILDHLSPASSAVAKAAADRAAAAAAPMPAVDDFGRVIDTGSAPPPPTGQSQVAADVNAVGQGAVSGTGAVIAGTGRQISAAAARLAPGQLAAMDAIDRNETVPAEQDPIGYGSMSDADKATMRKEFPAAAADIANRTPNALTTTGTAIENAAPTMFPVAPENEGIQTGTGRLLGGLAPALAATAVGTAAGGPVGGLLATAAVIGSQTYDSTYRDAIANKASPAEAEDAAGKASLAQMAIQVVPLGRAMALVPVPLREGFAKTLVNIGQSGIEVGGANALGTLAQNYVAQQSYDPTRSLTEGIGTAGLEGTIAGLVIRGGSAAMQAARASAAAPAAVADIGAASNVDDAIAAAAKATAAPGAAMQPVSGWGDLFGRPSPAGAETSPAAPSSPDVATGATAPTANPGWRTVDPYPSPDGRGLTTIAPEQFEAFKAGQPPPAAATVGEPQSVGAAASNDLDPGVGKLTPAQELAYRSTAEGQKLLEPQSFGTSDNTAYVPGVTPNAVETSQNLQMAREFKALKITNPDVAQEAAVVHASNSDFRQQSFQQLAGSDVDVANATAARNTQMENDLQTVWANKGEADVQPVIDAGNTILDSAAGRRPLVVSLVNSVLRQLNDRGGQPITDPELLYGVGAHINDLLDKNDAGGAKVNRAAAPQLMMLKNALYNDVIEPAAPGFQQALDNYQQASRRIDEMTALQKFEPKLFDANSRMTYAKVQTMMRQIVDSRQTPGLNPYKSISDDTMAGLWNLRDDLRRTAAADNLSRTLGGSDTTQNAVDIAKEAATGVAKFGVNAFLRGTPILKDVVGNVAQPLLDARAAKARSARGMAILHPTEPPVEQQDQPPPAAPPTAQPIPSRPPPVDLFNRQPTPAPSPTPSPGMGALDARQPAAAPAQTPIEREQADVAAMKAKSATARSLATAAQSGNFYDSTTALTPAGTPVAVRYVLREASDLTPSQTPDGSPNPVYPPELQPRDRTRGASLSQINHIKNTLQPSKLGYAADTATGAPVVGPDGAVESGNGRTMAIQAAYAEGGTAADSYRAWLAGQGFNIQGMKQPVLVRERTAPLDMAARARLADEMGASPTMAMSAPERAAADSKRIPTDVLSLIQRGDVTSVSNAPFVRAFATHAIPANEHASFMTADGDLSVEGATRVRNALTQRAYGSNALVTSLAEDADPELKAFGGALVDAAGPMAKLRGAIEAGSVAPDADISSALVAAAEVIQTARRARISIADAVAQTDAFAPRNPFAEKVLQATFGDDLLGRMSRPKLAGLLANFAAEMQVQSDMFGENKTAEQVFSELTKK